MKYQAKAKSAHKYNTLKRSDRGIAVDGPHKEMLRTMKYNTYIHVAGSVVGNIYYANIIDHVHVFYILCVIIFPV